MGETNAERQREYRERKKRKAGSTFLESERKRQKKYYVNTENLTPKQRKDRREAVRSRVRKHREGLKAPIQPQPDHQTTPQNLIVSIPFSNKGESSKKIRQSKERKLKS